MRASLVPFFHRRVQGPAPTKRLLLISYHFPPSTAAGALRWQKLARYAAEDGWELDVITLDPEDVRYPDWDRLQDLPTGTRVFGIPRPQLRREQLVEEAWQHVKNLRVRFQHGVEKVVPRTAHAAAPSRGRRFPPLAIRTYNSLVDYEVGQRWAMDAAWLAEELGTGRPHNIAVTCGPPHTVHLAGLRLHQEIGLPFVMDMRDPWSLVERLADPIDSATWRRLAEQHERRVVQDASLIVANTEASRDAMRERYPALAQRIVTVMNGFDDDPVQRRPPGGRFVIAYAGSIYLDRDPRPLFEAAARVVQRNGLEPREFGIRLVGTVAEFAHTSIAALARQAGLEGYVEIEGQRSRRDLWDILSGAAVLVSLPQDSHMAIPSKVFEYMQFEAWILAMAEPESATGRLLRDTAAAVVGSTDVDRIAGVLDDWYRRHTRGERPARLADETRFGRRSQAELLFDHLDHVLG